VIGQETIDRVRDATNLVALIGESVKLTRRGRSWLGLCPFHQEKTPSFHVNEERGFFHCFGCGAHGDGIRFLQDTEGLAFHEAVRRLADRAGIPIMELASEAERSGEAAARRRLEELYDANARAAAFFERALREHPLRAVAEAELARRGLVAASPTDPIADALQAFRIGYAPYGWDGLSRHLRDASSQSAAE
jgi:DNA primase